MHVKGSLCFLSLPCAINPEICAPQPEVSHFSPSQCVSYVRSQAWLKRRCRNLTDFQIRLSLPLKQGKFVFRGRKRILSQNRRRGASPFPCAAKQSPHSLLSKWHLIWFCCWSFQYPECFQDIYSVCRATLARYEKSDEPSHTIMHTHTHKWRKTSWNKTTGSRSDFTGYTRSCETEVEIQIGLTRKVWSPSLVITCCEVATLIITNTERKILITQDNTW